MNCLVFGDFAQKVIMIYNKDLKLVRLHLFEGLFDKLFGEVGEYRAAIIGLGNVSKSVLWDWPS